ESGVAGQLVWWINGDVSKTQDIYLKYKDASDDSAIKLTINFTSELTGIGVTARTTSTNGDKITVGDVTGSNKDYAVAITQNGELATVTSPKGDGKWFGLQLAPTGITSITDLQYKTTIQNTFADLTEADVTESGVAGQLVWWINGDVSKTQDIYLKYKDASDDSAIKLTINFTAAPDTTFPTAIKLGDNSEDVILNIGTTTINFNEEIDSESKTIVEKMLTAGANNALSYLWLGSSLKITTTAETTFSNDVIIPSISDLAGNTSTNVLLIDSKIEENQKEPNESGNATLNGTTPEVVVNNTVSSVTVNVEDGTDNATVNYDALISGGTGTIPQTTIHTSVANVSIPSSTTVTSSDTSWDGVMSVPTVTNITVPNTSSETRTTDSAIQVGFSGARLSFSNAVRLLLPGQAQKRAGYTTDGINFIEITNTCSADTQEVGNALPSDGECKIAVGTDLVIWTKHFTTFATFIATPIVYGGGGGSYTAVNNSLIVPTGGYTLTINNGDERTLNQQVILSLNGGSNATKMVIVNGDSFANTSQENYSTSKNWMLTSGEGEKQVCVRFYSASGEYSDPVCASIYFGAESEGEVLGAEDENMEVTSIGQSNTLIATLLSLIQSKISEGSITDSQARTFLLSLIQSIISNLNPTVVQQTYSCDGVTFDRDLEIGAEGEDVRCLQQILNSDVETQVASEGEGSSGNETIYFGELTKRALIKFQIKNGIAPAEGYFGSITRAFLDQ
ncbi:MAG: peptidoglycan-binding protein, partial [Bacilli bacterium]|nr:peptidoglycan-binding protein [Bacilli bacterium]